jgi:DNA-directed RNA polymerase subunit F
MILSKKYLTMAEVQTMAKSDEPKPIHDYLKKYTLLSKKDAEELKSSITALNNPKLKEEHIIKIVDFLPKDLEDLNKIVSEANLSDTEANAILDLTKKY